MHWSPVPSNYAPYLRQKVKQGRGIGVRQSYKPWYTIREGPMAGTLGMPQGIRTGRRHDLRTQHQRAYFFNQERRREFSDFLELFPILTIAETLELCGSAGIEHPYKGPTPEPFVIDCVIAQIVDGVERYEARDFLTADPAHLQVKQAWCQRRGIPWCAIDPAPLTREVLNSLIYVRGWFRHKFNPANSDAEMVAAVFHSVYKPHLTLKEIEEIVASRTRQDGQLVHNKLLYAMWANLIPIDIRHPITLNMPVVLLGSE